jgi:hypothetical protein
MEFKPVLLQTPAVVCVQAAQHLDQSFCRLQLAQQERHFSLQLLARVKAADLALAQVLSCFLPVQKRLMLSVAAVEDFLSLVILALI